MDVSFSNVLEGARQYFQGLPAGGGGAPAGPAYYPETAAAPGRPADAHPPPGAAPAAGWPPQLQPQDAKRPPTREQTPVQRPPSHGSDGSRPPSHPQYMQDHGRQYHGSYQEHQSQQTFQFPRPQSRDLSNHQYQVAHVPVSSPYQPPASPQMPRAPSREQLAQPSHNQTYQNPHQQNYQANPQTQNYRSQPQSYETPQTQSYQTHAKQGYNNNQRSYYPVPSQAASTPNNNFSASQNYSTTAPNVYYKNIYSTQTPTSQYNQYGLSKPSNSYHEQQQLPNTSRTVVSENNDQNLRTTHNLPPIAAISSYNRSMKEPIKNVNKISSSNSYNSNIIYTNTTTTNSSPVFHQNIARSTSYPTSTISNDEQINYNRSYNTHSQQPYSYDLTPATQPYQSVIVTSNTSVYTSSNQTQSSSGTSLSQPSKTIPQNAFKQQETPNANSNHFMYQQPQQPVNNANERLASTAKPRKESPLDLSVKTVRTPADSTLEESDMKYYQRATAQSGISTHNYPTLDVHSMQRNFTQRSLPSATAPKVEFHPNFSVPNVSQASKGVTRTAENCRRDMLPNKTYHNNVAPDLRNVPQQQNIQQQNITHHTYPAVSVPNSSYVNSYIPGRISSTDATGKQEYQPQIPKKNLYPYEIPDINKKRSGENAQPVIPNKVPKVETWRRSIDLQIDQKLFKYEKEHLLNSGNPTMNGSFSSINNTNVKDRMKSADRSKEIYNYQKSNFDPISQHTAYNNTSCGSYAANSHSQTYVHSTVSQQYTQYQEQHLQGLVPSSRSFSKSSQAPNKNSGGPGVKQQVINRLRNSLEVKGQKKLEQQKNMESLAHHPNSEVQHPSTDVTAPLQPKTALTGRNASPFTSTSFPENSIISMYRTGKANFEQDVKGAEKMDSDNTLLSNRIPVGGDFDGLAAFLAAARIPVRTKGELKQVASHNNNQNSEARLQEYIENQLKSPPRQETSQENFMSQSSGTISTTTTNSASPAKTLKERQTTFIPRKKLFSRNDDEHGNFPRAGLRSSSETSVFDFIDSDSGNEMPVLERQSLNSMRKDRSSWKYPLTKFDRGIKCEMSSRPSSPEDDVFSKLCDNFVEQLKNGSPIHKSACETTAECDTATKSETVSNNNEVSSSDNATLKQEKTEPPTEETKTDIKLDGDNKDSEFLISKCETQQEPNLTTVNTSDVVKRSISLSDDSDNEVLAIKKELIKEKQHLAVENIIMETAGQSEIKIEISKIVTEESIVERPDPDTGQKVDIKDDCEKSKSENGSPVKVNEVQIIRPAKKPSFGDGSDFYPGWEEGVYKYKKSLRMPPSLIQVTRPPASMRLSTSLPDLDPYPQSPTTSVTAADIDNNKEVQCNKKSLRKVRSDPTEDSDSESTSSFNIFSKTNYDSEGSASVTSLPNTKKESQSIIDKLLERYGGKKRKKYKRKDDHSPKVIPKAEHPIELLPTPSLEVSKTQGEEIKELKKLKTPVIKAESALLGFRKDTINNFKDAFINSSNNILGVHDKFATVVLKSRTRKETRVLKQRATIKEVFGEDRPASAPPVTCVNNIEIKQELEKDSIFSSSLQEIVIKKEVVEEVKEPKEDDGDTKDAKQLLKNRLLDKGNKKNVDNLLKTLTENKIKTEAGDDNGLDNGIHEVMIKKDPDAKSETPSLDGDESGVSGKKRSKFGKIRRKFSSGFDYLRKKRKVKKDNSENDGGEKKEKKRKGLSAKVPESIDDIHKEIKTWVLNKGIGETHLHRAARLGYADVVAYCLEKMDCQPSPKDNAGYTPLHEACSRGHLDIAKLLLKYGANAHESAQGGIRPLHEAVENGYIEIIRLLLSYGADPKLATYAGVVPLDLASDEDTKNLLINYMNDQKGEEGPTWNFYGPASCFDPADEIGYNLFEDVPDPDQVLEGEDIDIEMSEMLLPNLYTLRGEPTTDRWVLLQELSNILKIKSRDALLRQICPPSTSSVNVNYKSGLRELKMTDFLDQARCCQFLNQGEKINTRASKIALVKYTDKVRELLGIENVLVTNR